MADGVMVTGMDIIHHNAHLTAVQTAIKDSHLINVTIKSSTVKTQISADEHGIVILCQRPRITVRPRQYTIEIDLLRAIGVNDSDMSPSVERHHTARGHLIRAAPPPPVHSP